MNFVAFLRSLTLFSLSRLDNIIIIIVISRWKSISNLGEGREGGIKASASNNDRGRTRTRVHGTHDRNVDVVNVVGGSKGHPSTLGRVPKGRVRSYKVTY